ncbi:MAG: carboxypeptidase-like regulatory domain-containing protein [Planctomycetota bacterium]
MRWLLLFLLAGPVSADDVALREVRAWRGEIVLEARSGPGDAGAGEEVQTERATFVLLSDPRRTDGARERLQLRQRRAEGKWSLALDYREKKGGSALVTKGGGEGVLHVDIGGVLDLTTRRVELVADAGPRRLVAKTTLSGVDTKGFAAFRTAKTRSPYMAQFAEWGELSKDGREAKGERTFVDKRARYPRTVTLRWSLTRLDPEVKGRLVDQNGRPIVGAKVVARTMQSGRLIAREAVSDAAGRFRIAAHFASWGVQVHAHAHDGTITTGWLKPDAARILFDEVPDLKIELKRYRIEWLPQPHLLGKHFRGDADRYLAHVTRRASKARLAGAEVRPSTN